MTHIPEKNAAKKSGQHPKEELLQPPPPDGGWGWVVVFASFMVHVITDGVTYSYGVFLDGFMTIFQCSNQEASWVVSLLVGVTYCSGPVSSFLVNKFGCRIVTIAGTILASCSLLASVWAKNLLVLYLTAGIGTGFGFGLIYLPAIVSVTIYFEKYRSLATGIAVCGSGFGTVIFAPFITYLIKYYGSYKNAMMVLSGIVLNCIIFGIMFRPLEPVKSSECIPLKEVQPSNGTAKQTNKQSTSEGTKEGLDRFEQLDRRLSIGQKIEASPKYSNADAAENNANSIRLALSQPILVSKDTMGNSNSRKPSGHSIASGPNGPSGPSGEPFPRTSCGSGIMHRSDVFLRSSIHNIRKRSESLTNSEENIRLRLSLRSLPNGAGHKAVETIETIDDCKEENIIKRMLQFTLLRDPLLIIFIVSNFCTSIGYNVPYAYLMYQATDKGLDAESASALISVIGIANTVGRIVLGYISDKPWVNRLLVYNWCLTICGLATAFSPFCNSFVTFAIYASVFGFMAGAYVGLTSVCLVDLVGLEHLTNAFGLVLLSQGTASFLGPPIAGALKDLTNSYAPGFYVAGTLITISGIMLYIIPPIQRRMLKITQKLQRIDAAA